MALEFPTSPTNDQVYENYIYDASRGIWKLNTTAQVLDDLSNVNVSSPENGEVLEYNSSTSQWVTGTRPISNNAVINGAFDIWQRGTTFTTPATNSYTADRIAVGNIDAFERSTDTPGDFSYSAKLTNTDKNFSRIILKIEAADAAKLAGKIVTYSFWIKPNQETVNMADAFTYLRVASTKDDFSTLLFGDNGDVFGNQLVADTWQRISRTSAAPLPAEAKNGIQLDIFTTRSVTPSSDSIVYITGIQLEEGNVATPFRRNANSIQGELAACQRYFQRLGGDLVNDRAFGTGWFITSDTSLHPYTLPVEMRAAPTASASAAGTFYLYRTTGATVPTSVGVARNTKQNLAINVGASGTINTPTSLIALGTANAFIDLSAEL